VPVLTTADQSLYTDVQRTEPAVITAAASHAVSDARPFVYVFAVWTGLRIHHCILY